MLIQDIKPARRARTRQTAKLRLRGRTITIVTT